MSADPYELSAAHRPVVERGAYIPSWYKGHSDLSVRVVDTHGGDLGFTVADVLPERRWAITESGKLLGEQQFENRYRDWIGRVVAKDGRIVAMGAVNKYFDVTLESIPNADDFVDAKLDPMRPGELRFVPIGTIQVEAKHSRTKIRPLYNANGVKVVAGEPQPAPAEGFAPMSASAVEMVVTRCGKEVVPNRLNQHQAICKACKMAAVQAVQEAGAA